LPVIELDLLIAFVNSADKRHRTADRIFSGIMAGEIKNVKVASSAYLEYELVHRSLGYPAEETRKEISSFKNFPNLREEPLTAKVTLEAIRLRKDLKDMTYFDSFHASTARLYDSEIISSDPIYDKVSTLQRIEPAEI